MADIEAKTETKDFGFSVQEGANWAEYLAFRPLYPASFFNRIFEYHAQKAQVAHGMAHDVGAGCGIISSTLAYRFDHVVVSDPNDGHTTVAKKLLVEDAGIPESKYTFLQESAEKSSVGSGTIDLITACEMMHWTDPDAAIKEFGRELKVGGSLVLTYYTRPRIVGNDAAQEIWERIFYAYAEREQGELYDRVFRIANTGFQHVGFPDVGWESIKRVYVNTAGSVEPFKIDDRLGESRVKKGEEAVWIESDEDWCDVQGINWIKGYFATWNTRMLESDIQNLWDDLESALNGAKAKLETPLVMIFATKKS